MSFGEPSSLSSALIRARLLRAAIDGDGPVEPTPDNWPAWKEVALTGRVVPALYRCVSEAGLDLEAALREEIDGMQLDVAATCVRLEQSLLEVAANLSAADVKFAVLKGNATAHLDYGDPGYRQFGDVDVLVDPAEFAYSQQVLERAGWQQKYALPPGHEYFTHAVTVAGRGIAEIDLHQHIAHRALGILIPTDQLLAGLIPLTIAGSSLWALNDIDRVIHACTHAVASHGEYLRLSSWADVLVLARKTSVNAIQVLERSEIWRIRPLIETAIRGAFAQALLPVPEQWDEAMQAPLRRRSRLVEHAYLGSGRSVAGEELAHMRHMKGWASRYRYMRGHVQMRLNWRMPRRTGG